MHPILAKLLTTAAVYVGAVLIEAMIREMSKVEDNLNQDVHGEHTLNDAEFDDETDNVTRLHAVQPEPMAKAGAGLIAEMKKFAEGNRILPILLKSLGSNNSN